MTGAGKRLIAALVAAMLAAGILSACGGEDSSGTDQFRDATESSLLDFGKEGSESESEQASLVVSGFLAARAAGDWQSACQQLANALVEKLENLAAKSTGLEDKTCASLLDSFAEISAAELDEESAEGGSLRYAGNKGFLIYFCADDVVCAMSLEKDGDEWKVAGISAKRLS